MLWFISSALRFVQHSKMEAAETEKRTSRYLLSKFRKMKIKASILVCTLLTFGLLMSCDRDDPTEGINSELTEFESSSASTSRNTLSDKEIAYVQDEMRKGMVSFVDGVKPIYREGMNLETFTSKLVGDNHARNMTPEGRALLDKAFEYLSKGASPNDILKTDTGSEIASALLFVKTHNYKNKTEDGDLVLFGNTTGEDFPSDSQLNERRRCKWYQIGCHLSNIWNWLVENHETILEVLTTVAAIIALF